MMISATGIEYRYIKHHSAKDCVVINTGANVTIEDNRWLQDELAKRYSVLLFNRGGYGRSPLNTKVRTPEVVSQELHSLLIELDIKNAILLGPSLGGLYGRYFNYKYPDLVKALVAVDSPISFIVEKIEAHLPKDIKQFVQQELSLLKSINPVVDSELLEVTKLEFTDFSYHQKPVLNFCNTYLGDDAEFVSQLIVDVAKQEAEKEGCVRLAFSATGHDIISNDLDFFLATFHRFIDDINSDSKPSITQ